MRLKLTLVLVLVCSIAQAQDAPLRDLTFGGELASAVFELKEQLKAEKVQSLRLGPVQNDRRTLPDSSFSVRFEQELEKRFQDQLDESSGHILSGEFFFVKSPDPPEKGLPNRIQFTLEVTNPNTEVVATATREFHNTDDLSEATGTTIAAPDDPSFEKRNSAVAELLANPRFKVRNETQVMAPDNDGLTNRNHTVEIWKHIGGTGKLVRCVPRDIGGKAFVNLNLDDTFEVIVYNHDTECHATAIITIDGLDVANSYSEDAPVTYDGYLIPPARDSKPGRHRVRGWLVTTKRETDNVHKFMITTIGGGPQAKKPRNRRGVINVQFFETVPEGQTLRARSTGTEVGAGELLDVKMQTKRMQRRDTAISNVSIRYKTAR